MVNAADKAVSTYDSPATDRLCTVLGAAHSRQTVRLHSGGNDYGSMQSFLPYYTGSPHFGSAYAGPPVELGAP